MFKVNIKNTGKTSLTLEKGVLLLTLNIFHTFFSVSIVDFQKVNISWDIITGDLRIVVNS